MYCGSIEKIKEIIPPSTNLATAYAQGHDNLQKFIQNLALFLTIVLKNHGKTVIEPLIASHPNIKEAVLYGHYILVEVSQVKEREIWKICLEYWYTLAADLFHEPITGNNNGISQSNSFGQLNSNNLFLGNPDEFITQTLLLKKNTGNPNAMNFTNNRRQMYNEIMHKIREVIINRMPKPEEVLIIEDENGNIIRESVKDTDSIQLYKSMKDTLIYLTHLDPADTQSIMIEKLTEQVGPKGFIWDKLNRLCWAIGSITGAQKQEEEKRFLVHVIRELLELCDVKRGKDNKAVIASNIMYIVGQYPRFLRAHWKFLKTVVNKLFEFMHELHPGVQDMACDTFLKIAQKCKRKFVVVQMDESTIFIEEIILKLPNTMSDLKPNQIHTFYEALGHIISIHNDPQIRRVLVQKSLEIPNMTWARLLNSNNSNNLNEINNNNNSSVNNVKGILELENIQMLTNLIKTNLAICKSLNENYYFQLLFIFNALMEVYQLYSSEISSSIARLGHRATGMINIRSMRTAKQQILNLMEEYFNQRHSIDFHNQNTNFIPKLLEAILIDYQNNIPEARDGEVLTVLSGLFSQYPEFLADKIEPILETTFGPTLSIITFNFEDYPTVRVCFFNLIKVILKNEFNVLFNIFMGKTVKGYTIFKLIIDSIIWGFKHPARGVAETGLEILVELLENVNNVDKSAANINEAVRSGVDEFYKMFFIKILSDIFYVLTDSVHKSGFKLQCLLLKNLFSSVETNQIRVPLYENTEGLDENMMNVIKNSNIGGNRMSNAQFVRIYTMNLLLNAFGNLGRVKIEAFVNGLAGSSVNWSEEAKEGFKEGIRDFLIGMNEFAGKDNSELWTEEREREMSRLKEEEDKKAMAVPGMIGPYDSRHNDQEIYPDRDNNM
eukprot:TRINITY_DN6707_c0_g1_i1.p1 TRINITY_DN6707_c0_g1~~TRINITY_DN6707_c0_g1_i1.p1  ORF type:complete len:1027 (-),score=229.71 TRINITY_DN6707_c0_g1_i1:91-2766(-)